MVFDALEIEITRDCNLFCPHCMRYEPGESMEPYRGSSIPREYIDALFEKHKIFGEILLTGGEPLLHPEIISYIIDKIIEKKILLKHFQIATNGTIINDEVITSLNKLYEYINENVYKEPFPEAVLLCISDGFHDNLSTKYEALKFYKERLLGTTELFNSETPEEGKSGLILHYSGRAKNFSAPNVTILPEAHRYKIALNEDLNIMCMLDLTMNGNFVISSCHSFQEADAPENIICSVYDDLFLGILQWNYRNPLNCEEAGNMLEMEYILQQENLFDEFLTEKQKEKFPDSIEFLKDEERRRINTHLKYPSLYPDDIERLQNTVAYSDWSDLKKWLYFLAFDKKRKEEPIDFANFSTCPHVVSKDEVPVIK